jgi:hypothetical protein
MDEGFLHKADIHDDIRTLKVSNETEAEGCGGGFPCQARIMCKVHLLRIFVLTDLPARVSHAEEAKVD